MWNALPTYLNQVWNYCFMPETGRLEIVAGEMQGNAPTRYDKVIAVLEDSPVAEERAKLISNAPDMFKILCNIAGEVKYGTVSLPDFVIEDIDSVLHDIAKQHDSEAY